MLDENFAWVYPPWNVPAHTIGPVHLYDTIELSWTPSTLYIAPPYTIQMACFLANQTYVFVPLTNISSPYLWFFKENYDTQPYGCWYGFETPPGGQGGTGASFNVVTVSAATPITFRATATSSSTTSSMQTTTTTSAAMTTTSAAATDTVAASDSGLSSGAKAGIGVGVAVGAMLLIALVLGILFLRRKKRQGQTAPKTPEVDTIGKHPYEQPPLAYAEAEAPYPYVEADAQEARLEMPA